MLRGEDAVGDEAWIKEEEESKNAGEREKSNGGGGQVKEELEENMPSGT